MRDQRTPPSSRRVAPFRSSITQTHDVKRALASRRRSRSVRFTGGCLRTRWLRTFVSRRYTDQRERRGEPARRGRRVWRLRRIAPTVVKKGSESSSQPRTEARPSLRERAAGVDFFALFVPVALDRMLSYDSTRWAFFGS